MYKNVTKENNKCYTSFQDPEVSAAFQDISSNPANIAKYQNNPKVQIKCLSTACLRQDAGTTSWMACQ